MDTSSGAFELNHGSGCASRKMYVERDFGLKNVFKHGAIDIYIYQ